MMEIVASTMATRAGIQNLKVVKMNTAPVRAAAIIGMKLGPATRRHCIGVPSRTEVMSVSRFPSSASGR